MFFECNIIILKYSCDILWMYSIYTLHMASALEQQPHLKHCVEFRELTDSVGSQSGAALLTAVIGGDRVELVDEFVVRVAPHPVPSAPNGSGLRVAWL